MAVKGGIEIIKALARKLITRDQTGIKRIYYINEYNRFRKAKPRSTR